MSPERKSQKTVLHITPHLGGGVGRVLLNYLAKSKGNSDFRHDVLSLDHANEKACEASKTTGFTLADIMSSDHEKLLSKISRADVVLIHWWNHPLLYALLVRERFPPARIIVWSHISGFHAPYVFNKAALHYPDIFVFTSPLSLDVPEVKDLPEERLGALRVIWSTGGVDCVASVRSKPHKGFNVGYIGTVDYSKMHPAFLRMSSMIKIPDAKFIVCGGPSAKKIQEESLKYEMGERFLFAGQIDNITEYLSEFDVFGYPLAPYHWGTCEQSLGESMAAGVPPVVMANPTESLIVENGLTGIVAADEDAYVRAIERLYHNPYLRQRLGGNSRKEARERYSLDMMVKRWEDVFCEALRFQKTPRQWTGRRQGKRVSAAGLFIESLGSYGREFDNSLTARNGKARKAALDSINRLYGSSHLWRAKTRGTANHYSFFFPEDNDLKLWRTCTL